jgi:hypothetical protein
MKLINPAEWQQFLLQFPESHILQTAQWGTCTRKWRRLIISSGMTLLRAGAAEKIFLGFNMHIFPKGPSERTGRIMGLSGRFAKQSRGILKVEPV